MLIRSILIANRGEVACRMIKTAKRLGIKTYGFYNVAVDKNSLFVEHLDVAIAVENQDISNTYLKSDIIVDIVKKNSIDAVFVGYGFLAENADFVSLLEKEGINFIGAKSSSIKALGDKFNAKILAKSANVPLVPSCEELVKDAEHAIKEANRIGYPVILKAVAGGGGKGIRIVNDDKEMKEKLTEVRYEGENLFKNSDILMEKYIEEPRHIEIQIVADKHGNIVCVGERECSIQRMNQKIIEETPSVAVNDDIREKMYDASIRLAKACNYTSVGTIEYILTKEGNFYFMEMNTRLQVEHGITECVYDVDLIELMIMIAEGNKLPFSQKDIKSKGWAFECRICGENPAKRFLPSVGKVLSYIEPSIDNHTRIDTGIQLGDTVSVYFDSMLVKLITYGATRNEALTFMKQKLSEYEIGGIETNISFLENIIRQHDFESGDINTKFIQKHYPKGFNSGALDDDNRQYVVACAVCVFLSQQKRLFITNKTSYIPRDTVFTKLNVVIDNDKGFDSFLINIQDFNDSVLVFSYNEQVFTLKYKNDVLLNKIIGSLNGGEVSLSYKCNTINRFLLTGHGISVYACVYTPDVYNLHSIVPKKATVIPDNVLLSPISGVITQLSCKAGDIVEDGTCLLSIQAMKMNNQIIAEYRARVKNIFYKVGDVINIGDRLIEFDFIND